MEQPEQVNRITEAIIGAAIEVHRALGPGLLESAYEACLAYELRSRGFTVETQKPVPVLYHDVQLDCGYRLDLLVENQVIIEIKAVDAINAVHQAQLLSYLRLTHMHAGLIINFHVKLLKQGIQRLVNDY